MKRLFTLFLIICAVTSAFAASYGILVNDKDYYAGTVNPSPMDPSFQEYMVLNLSLAQGDKAQLYDADNKAAWTVTLDPASVSSVTLSGGYYQIKATGCYDFYIKLQYENDQLYIGTGTNCKDDPDGPNPPVGYTSSAPAQYPGVMLQAFYWDSYEDKGHGRTKWIDLAKQASEMGQWFDLVWLPPSAQSTGGTGYLPISYSVQDGAWGTKPKLQALIDTLHLNGCRVVADMVINHSASSSGWCTMAAENFGRYGTFNPTMEWICSTDEAFGQCTENFGNPDDGYGSEANYEAGRDWDHNSAKVRDMFKAYARWMIYEVGYDGFRYDYCKGFHNSHINEYNRAAEAFFSVMEYWDGNVNTLQTRLNDAGWNTCTFDFATKYQALNDGIAAGNYGGCKGAGLPGVGKARYAVTFVDSHDSYQRDGNEFMGPGNSMKNLDGKTMQANAYILCMPGTPCVFYPHWVEWKEDIKKIINARYKAGVHNESAVSDEAGSGFYKATITGSNGQIRLLLGPNSGYGDTPSGFTLAAKGQNWGVYYKTNTPRGNKNEERKPIVKTDDTQDLPIISTPAQPAAKKVLENGQIIIIREGIRYTLQGVMIE